MNKAVIASALGIASLPILASAYTVPSIDFDAINVPNPTSYDNIYDWKMALTDDQKTVLKDTRKELRAQVKADMQNATDEERSEIKAALQTARETKKAMFDQLSDEQKEELKALRGDKDGRKRFGKKRMNLENMTEEQRAEFEAKRAERRAQFENMTDEEKAEMRANRQGRRGFAKKIRGFFGGETN